MKWDIWVRPNQIFTENYPNGWSSDEVERAANNRYGGMVTCVSPAPSRGSHESYNGRGGGGSSSGGSGEGLGCLPLLGLGALVIFGGVFAGSDGIDSSPATPERSYSAPVERVAPAAPEPQFKDYASPPPTYCVNENFEPC